MFCLGATAFDCLDKDVWRMFMSAMHIPLVPALEIAIAWTKCGIIIVSFSNVNIPTQKTTTQ